MRLGLSKIRQGVAVLRESLKPGVEHERATRYWAGLESYHSTNDTDEVAIQRSRWLAEEVLAPLQLKSILELGCNTGRNLFYIGKSIPGIRLGGIDVNEKALEVAKQNLPYADLQ